jgi:tetratricopeptide (TPR) repeat protein
MRRAGVEIFRDRPLTGAGPGLYVALYPEHDGAYPFAAVHSHNVAVQIAADYGVVGLVAGAIMLACAGLLLYRVWRRGETHGRLAVATCTGALAAFLVHGLADSPHLFPEVLVLLAVAVGLVLRADGAETRDTRPARIAVPRGVATAVPLLALAVGLALLPLWWRNDRAAAEHQRSVRAATRADWDTAVAAEQRAVDRDPGFAAYDLQLGAVYAARYTDRGDTADRDAAIRAYERGLAREPRNGAALVDLASLKLDVGDRAGALDAMQRLKLVQGRDGLLQLAYAVLVQRTGSAEEAVETYAGLLALNPTLALTPFWRDDQFRAAHYDAIVERALQRIEEITGPGPAAESLRTALRVFTGRDVPDEGQLRAALAATPRDLSLQVALGRLLVGGGRRAEAEPLLRDAVALTSDSADAHAALGDWYAAGGDIPHARHEWLLAAWLGDVRSMDALGQSYAMEGVPRAIIDRQRSLLEGAAVTRFYLLFQTFRFTFQRHEPVPIIRPGDWLDALPDEFPTWQGHLARWQDKS